jgi:arginase
MGNTREHLQTEEARGEHMPICLIQVPYMLGDAQHGASMGPQRFVQAGAEQRLAARGVAVTVERIARGEPFHDGLTAALAVSQQLAPVVRQAIAARQLPLVLAGSCDVCMGILGGFDHARCGVVWCDAHGDFNTPETTISGFFPGMSLAIITGHCYQDLWAQIGNNTPIAEAATLLLGVRDLDEAEQEHIQHSAIQMVPWHAGKPQADIRCALDTLAQRVAEVYVHIDLDALDPHIAPGIVDPPVPGGLSLPDMEAVIRAVAARFWIRAAALTTYNPNRDRDKQTLRVGLRIIELLAECASDGKSR